MDTLKPCPFCGHQAASEKMLTMLFAYVECDHCNSHGPMKWGVEAALEAWNQRFAAPVLDQQPPSDGHS